MEVSLSNPQVVLGPLPSVTAKPATPDGPDPFDLNDPSLPQRKRVGAASSRLRVKTHGDQGTRLSIWKARGRIHSFHLTGERRHTTFEDKHVPTRKWDFRRRTGLRGRCSEDEQNQKFGLLTSHIYQFSSLPAPPPPAFN